jgi:hypothetical protein
MRMRGSDSKEAVSRLLLSLFQTPKMPPGNLVEATEAGEKKANHEANLPNRCRLHI